MFDIGNEVRLRINGQWSSPLYYTQDCDGSHPHPIGLTQRLGDATYATCKLPMTSLDAYRPGYGAAFVLVAHSPSSAIDGFMTLGNTGADEGGQQMYNEGSSPLRSSGGAVGYYKAIYGANAPGRSVADASINHLIFGAGLGDATVKIGATTDSDLHEIKWAKGTTHLYYVLFAGKEGYEYTQETFQGVLDQACQHAASRHLAAPSTSNASM